MVITEAQLIRMKACVVCDVRVAFGLSLEDLPVLLTLRGKCAGRAEWRKDTKTCRICLNPYTRSEVDFMQTLIHEFAHIVDFLTHGRSDHGYNWGHIMIALGATPRRCHSMTLPRASSGAYNQDAIIDNMTVEQLNDEIVRLRKML
jgi:predicted SprT family Zn-dependent metalloprotease